VTYQEVGRLLDGACVKKVLLIKTCSSGRRYQKQFLNPKKFYDAKYSNTR
jgi:hypothetical protein